MKGKQTLLAASTFVLPLAVFYTVTSVFDLGYDGSRLLMSVSAATLVAIGTFLYKK